MRQKKDHVGQGQATPHPVTDNKHLFSRIGGPLVAASRGILAGLSWVVLLWTRGLPGGVASGYDGSGLPTRAGSATHME